MNRFVLLTLLLSVLTACGGQSPNLDWQRGYRAGMEVYGRLQLLAYAPLPAKDPRDAKLVNYCDQSELGTDMPLDPSAQWNAGYERGCYGAGSSG